MSEAVTEPKTTGNAILLCGFISGMVGYAGDGPYEVTSVSARRYAVSETLAQRQHVPRDGRSDRRCRMTVREGIAADLGKHLADDLQRTVERHRTLAEAGGASAVEWSAAMMIATETLIVQAMAGLVIFVAEEKRGEVFDVAVLKLVASINERRATVLKAATLTDALFRRAGRAS